MSELIKYDSLLNNIATLVRSSKQRLYKEVNSTITLTYWEIGRHIVEFEQGGKERAEYGKKLLKNLSADLTKQFGRGYSYRNLQLSKKFYVTFPIVQPVVAQFQKPLEQKPSLQRKKQKVQPLVAQLQKVNENDVTAQINAKVLSSIPKLNWTHFVRLLSVKDKDERNFYLIETAENNWSKRELDRQINSSLFERLLLSKDKKKVKELAQKGQLISSDDIIKDPYVLEFLGLDEKTSYNESDLESAIINNLELFLLELGKGFSFVARQKRISSGSDHFYIDLVFYNRLLQCHVLIDLKIGKLKHQDIGQMTMYVNYYDREIKTEYENSTIGIVLCKEQDDFVVEYSLPENNQQIFPKEYKLYLPDKEELKKLLMKYL